MLFASRGQCHGLGTIRLTRLGCIQLKLLLHSPQVTQSWSSWWGKDNLNLHPYIRQASTQLAITVRPTSCTLAQVTKHETGARWRHQSALQCTIRTCSAAGTPRAQCARGPAKVACKGALYGYSFLLSRHSTIARWGSGQEAY